MHSDMNELILKLREFQQERESQIKLEESFEKLARYLLYGGFFQCSKRFDLYITSVEFYYHEEDGEIKDPIMYHRNKWKWNKKQEKISDIKPYFEIGTLNPHISGVDITFEKPDKYRASALIRAFKVYDKIKKKWIEVFDKKKNVCIAEDNRSTYVYEYLFDGLSVDSKLNQLQWKNIDNNPSSKLKSPTTRQNVHYYVQSEAEAIKEGLDVEKLKVYDAEFFKTKKPCKREWRYSREDSHY